MYSFVMTNYKDKQAFVESTVKRNHLLERCMLFQGFLFFLALCMKHSRCCWQSNAWRILHELKLWHGGWAERVCVTTAIHTVWKCVSRSGLRLSQLKKKSIFITQLKRSRSKYWWASMVKCTFISTQSCHLKMIPILMCKATEAKSWMGTGWGADCHWLLHLHNMIRLHLKVWCWQHFFVVALGGQGQWTVN